MPSLSDMRDSANETARVARGNLILFLVVGLYLCLLIVSTNDLLLLKRAHIALPLMQIGVPIDLFYSVAPILFLLLHLNLLLRFSRLSHVAGLLRKRIEKLETIEQRSAETALLVPFDFLQLLLYRSGRGTEREPPPLRRFLDYWRYDTEKFGSLFPLLVIVVTPVFVFPLAVFVGMHIRFLPYQSESITLAHQIVITLDVAFQFSFLWLSGLVRQCISALRGGPWLDRVYWAPYIVVVPGYFLLALAFIWMIAVIPHSWLERHRPFPEMSAAVTWVVFGDWWNDVDCNRRKIRPPKYLRRYLYVPGTSIAAHDRPYELVSAYLRNEKDPDEAWKFIDELDLSERSFRYGWFDMTEFWRTKFVDSDLRCARFTNSKVRESVFDDAKMHHVNFSGADLSGASLDGVEADDARFERADLRGAQLKKADFRRGTFRGANFQRADLSQVRFVGTSLTKADFRSADVSHSDFIGVDLRKARFRGADLTKAHFRASDLRQAEFDGADLERVKIHGSNLSRGSFYGSDLRKAEMTAAQLRDARVHGANLRGVVVSLTDLRGIDWLRPATWNDVVTMMEQDLRERGVEEKDIRKRTDKIRKHTAETFHSGGLTKLGEHRCAWTDGRRSFMGRGVPSHACLKELDQYLVDMACENNNSRIAESVFNQLSVIDSWIEFSTGMAFLETDRQDCAAIGFELRKEICSQLTDWSRGPTPNVPAASVIPIRQQQAVAQRWARIREAGLCDSQ